MIYLQQVKQSNMSVILERIWQHNQISRVELVEHTSLTSGTITNLTHELIELNILRETEAVSGTVGRKRVLLGFDPHTFRVIGLDISRSSIELVVMDLNGTIMQSAERDMTGIQGPDAYLKVIRELVADAKKSIDAAGCRVLGLGVGVPGPIDHAKGTIVSPPNFPGWSGFPLQMKLEEEFGLVTLIEDDARTSALAERRYGLGKNVKHLVFVTMGAGIGGGVVTDGKIVRGTNGLCGQVGHMTIVLDGKLCDCGNRGCWETVGSIPGILSRWPHGSTLAELRSAALSGDQEAIKCIHDTLVYLEAAMINIQNLYDPELIVLGGSLYPMLADYMDHVKQRLRSRIYAFAKDRLNIEAATFKASQSAVGAAALLFDYLLSEPVRLLSLSERKVEKQ
ncbi:ROK family protein [Paenibacillus thalictri]|uniref:ROK family protein n=1 Tax=Paenibacillus thalictri TaxID=2527873 RepID=A0A4Q9DKY2_9BACL|nr:ROK family protein [Paenibacillus thalictri]TBL75023.1 ROK family protein [Paenibacillus thalictri]